MSSSECSEGASAAAYWKSGRYYLFTLSRAEAGFHLPQPPVIVLDESVSSEVLGDVASYLLSRSRCDVPTPPPSEYKSIEKGLLGPIGVRSLASLAKGARHADLTVIAGRVDACPVVPVGTRGEAKWLESERVRSVSMSHAHIGDAIRSALLAVDI